MTTAILAPGVHALPFPEYLSLEAWGSSSLRAMRLGPPARVLWERANPKRHTDATRRGTAVHCALLTPELYAGTYCYKPEGMSFATKEGRAWRDEHAGLEILTSDTASIVEGIVSALSAKDEVRRSVSAASHKETSLLWTCPASGETCKARPDWIEGKHVYSLKTSRYASSASVAWRAYSEGWMHQLAHERTGAIVLGLPVDGGRLVVVDPEPPHYVWTFEVKRDALDLLELENAETLKNMRVCREAQSWPGTPEEWTKLDVPAAALAQTIDFTEAEES